MTRCYCSRIAPIATRTRFALCIHPEEYRHQKSGTGRLCAIALKESRLFVGIDFSADAELNAFLSDPRFSPFLLYPGTPESPALNLSQHDAPLFPPDQIPLIVLIDGTWRQARKILHDSANLRALPRLAFTPEHPSRFLFKRQPKPECLSTIEAVHEVLGALEARGYEKPGTRQNTLLEILADLVEWQVSHRNTPKAVQRTRSLPQRST